MQWFGQHRSIATSCCSSWHHLVVAGLDKSAVLLWDLRSGEEEAELLGQLQTRACYRVRRYNYSQPLSSLSKLGITGRYNRAGYFTLQGQVEN